MSTRKTGRKKNAQGLVEFALVAPVLLLVLFGIVDMGWIAFNYAQVYNGFREGGRYGSVNALVAGHTYTQVTDCAGIRNVVVNYAKISGIQAANIGIYYDDGRVLSGAWTTGPAEVIGTCPNAGVYKPNGCTPDPCGPGNYVAQDTTTRNPLQLQNFDRIVILTTNLNLHFLTPFIQAVAPSGLAVNVDTARTLYPGGLSG